MGALARFLGRHRAKPTAASGPVPWRAPLWQAPADVPLLARPRTGARLNAGTTLHHDVASPELTVAQIPAPQGPAPFATVIEVYGFDGSYLSLAVDLDPAAAQGLNADHIVSLDLPIETETPVAIFARLNIRQGANVARTVRELVPDRAPEFDLAYAGLTRAPVEKLWLDLIFDKPAMTRIEIKDLRMARRRRAPL